MVGIGRKKDWKDKKIGLVLSGGGAKGAYQVGMFRALEELDLAGQIKVISGTSIGALNGAVYTAAGLEGMRDLMVFFGSQLQKKYRRMAAGVDPAVIKKAEEGAVSVEEFINDSAYSEYSTENFKAFLKEILPDNTLKNWSRKLYICAYSIERGRPEYFLLNKLEPEHQRDLILASASLPFVFPAVEYAGGHYLDGGCIPPVCGTNPLPADKIPLKPILEETVDALLVNYLIPSDAVDNSNVSEKIEYLELRPSYYLEQYPGQGTLDFSPEKLSRNEALGYRDTMELFLAEEENYFQKCVRIERKKT